MSVIPYQPTFSVQPKHGFRYLSQPQIPNVAPPANQPVPPRGLNNSQATPPPVMGTQASNNYLNDPFDSGQFGGVQDKRPIAQSYGYQQPASNVLGGIGTIAGMMAGVPGLGYVAGKIGKAMDQSGKPAYGSEGTYDAQGNVFGSEGRAYDPVTGSAAQSYASPESYLGNYLGVGTPEGVFGSSSSYGKLRNAGEGIPGSLLGSYDNSVYNVSRADRMRGITPAGQQGITTTYGLMRDNMSGEAYGDDFNEITLDNLGLDPNARDYGVPKTGLTGEIGTDAGDVFISGGSYNPYVVSDTGSMTGASGTLVSTTDPRTGEKVSLMSKQDGGGFTSAGAADIAETISPDYSSDDGGDEDYSGGGFSFSSSIPTQTAAERADEEAAEAEGGSWQDADDSDDSGGGK